MKFSRQNFYKFLSSKKQMKCVKVLACGIATALMVECLPIFPGATVVNALTTQQQIDQANRERQELQNQLQEQQGDIDDLKDGKKTLQGELRSLNEQLSNVGEVLEELEEEIEKKEQEIEDTQKALEEAIVIEEGQYDSMVSRMQNMYETSSDNYLSMLLFAGSFADVLNMADWFEKIALYDQKKLAEFKETRHFVEETKARLEQEKIELDNLKVSAEAEKNKVSGLISKTSNSISQYADQIEDAEQRALEYERELKQKEEDIAVLKQKLKEEMALSHEAAAGTWRDISEVSFAEGDRKLIANLIYCEAGAEPYAGQVAVGSVIINRVLSGKFPDTVVGVVYQSGQFSPVRSGRLELALASDRATAACYQAADEAMAGKTNVGNCVFFRTPIDGLTGIQIGGHIFY